MGELSRRWRDVLADHEASVAAFLAAVRQVPRDEWLQPRAPGKWSPAEEVLHVALTYEIGLEALTTGLVMRRRTSPTRARILRWFVLPIIVRTGWFPRASAPVEVRPLPGDAITPEEVQTRIASVANRLAEAARRTDPHVRFEHAYFGPLDPSTALRLLCAHTRHHSRVLAQASRGMRGA